MTTKDEEVSATINNYKHINEMGMLKKNKR